ncbi:hypothetical protein DICSQDRAFT_54612 [Dichomitus squalens LYAD-421 SS1]|uniref:uncharacterized protein n=1 Tax=Dichomitus squalens (strain LYAD-421) TaxID=732165 RepID=UPI0004412B61|nr:uncharacterized protein DICSQDRAFT_54612 [Dichomitus squalens LYAD-421 SS1]EJF63735.1 hypothetical protein DICSQDRAFT_54612 [Dichomitus squalens LYAD-421 SS1]
MPPLYRRFHEAELKLPQHDPLLPAPEGRNGRYLWIANHASKCGWGNAMQELFLNAYLAYRTNRAFVFDNYTWSRGESDYSLYNLKPIPSRIPLTALIQGPIAGGHFPAGSGIPRAVTPEYFYEVCQDRAIMSSYEVNDALVDPTAETLVQSWKDKMSPHRCVEIARSPPELFDEHVFADARRLLDVWPHFSQSPIVKEFSWSTLVELAFDNNREVISPTSPFEPTLSSSSVFGLARYSPIPGLLVLHIRRGDFQGHCHDVLARRSIGFTGFNSFPELSDQWHLPEGVSEREKKALYARRCFPEIDMIVERVEEIRRTPAGSGLTNAYIMTNGSPSWVSKLKAALRARHGWAHVASSRDLVLTSEQKYVSQALDMLVAQRAHVFIGNGFSTLSGMAVMLRMANRIAPDTSRHW